MGERLWLIFDAGTSGVKAALISEAGQIRCSAVQAYETFCADGGIAEQDAGAWWSAAVRACRALGDATREVSAVAVTGQMQDLILLDDAGEPVRPVILYSDTRARAEADEIIGRVGRERLRALTGNDQGADSLWAKLLWLRRHEPESLARARHLLFGAADVLVFRLTGVANTDTTTASTTGLMNLRERRWLDSDDFEMFGISEALPLLPVLSAGGAQVGSLLPSAAETLGLKPGLPVYHAPGDAGATTIGAGSGEIGRVYGYLGTSGWVAFTASEPGSPDQGVFTLAHPLPERAIQIAALLTAGGNLAWLRDLFNVEGYDSLIAEALARPLSSVLYLPYLNGERAPFSDPLARAAFIGMGQNTERADLYRAVLEGIAFAYRHALDSLLPERPLTLFLTGGGTRSESWCQLFADILEMPIACASDAENVGVRGALLAALALRGSISTYAPEGYPQALLTLEPEAARSEAYRRKYEHYRAAYPALKSLFASMSS
jgi:xylulokinase